MYEEIPYKFKYMLNKIIKCIIEYISKNLNNNLLIESKLILINNYILDIFRSQETSRNSFAKTKIKKLNHSKTFSDKALTPEFDKNITLSKFSNIFLNIKTKGKDSNISPNNQEIFPYKDKYKIMKLKKLLKNEQEKSMLKELSYLKRLSFAQEKLNFYESKIKHINESENKNISSGFINDEKKNKEKMKNGSINNLNNLTAIRSCKNKKTNFFSNDFSSNSQRIIKQSLSHSHVNDRATTKKNNKNKTSYIFPDKGEKLNELIKDTKKFIKTREKFGNKFLSSQ
jgi:hypothetical protein